jgi:hypothetical protein
MPEHFLMLVKEQISTLHVYMGVSIFMADQQLGHV